MRLVYLEFKKRLLRFIVGGCFLIGVSTQFEEPYRIVTFATGLILIPFAFIWNYMENRSKTKERMELQRKLKEQIERMKVKCPKCAQKVIPKKVGEMFLCPNCNYQFKPTRQKIEEFQKEIEVASDFFDLLESL